MKKLEEQGALRKDVPDKQKALRSLDTAKEFIKKAEQLITVTILDLALVESYGAMFHCARALLFKDGYKERSHYAVYIYAKEKYGRDIPARFLNELNTLRLDRHDFFYALERKSVDETEVKSALATAQEFLKIIEKIIKK